MTEDEHKMLMESHASARRVETYLFGDPNDPNPKKPSRADTIDKIIFGIKAGRLGYRLVLGIAALFVAGGTLWATFKGWNS